MDDLIEILRSTLTYLGNDKTLPFVRKFNSINRGRYKSGDPIGSRDAREDGYACIRIGTRKSSKLILMHRAVWMYHNGEIPKGLQIDHINHDRSDNRIENLRLATNATNSQNRKGADFDSVTGVLGVCVRTDCPKKPYFARITVNGKNYKTKQMASIEEAITGRLELEQKYGSAIVR